MPTDQDLRIGARLQALRKQQKDLSQDAFSRAMGFENRQTLSTIETGARRISPAELVLAAEILNVPISSFTDPFLLIGEAKFNFRVEKVSADEIDSFEAQASSLVATYRELSRRSGSLPGPVTQRLSLPPHPRYEDAEAAGEDLAASWQLGSAPSADLEQAIGEHLNILVLYVDAPDGLSGAASHGQRLDAIFINRNEPLGRRNFDLAHELFHVLTWDVLEPNRVESAGPGGASTRTEKLADNFAAALLMPRTHVEALWRERGGESLADWISRTSEAFLVTPPALGWRLVNLRLLDVDTWRSIAQSARSGIPPARPRLFSEAFVALVSGAVNAGELSLKRAAGLVGVSIGALAEICSEYGTPLVYDLTAE
jgi:XRE family transcriptional regulator, fatty acid utilization regulator